MALNINFNNLWLFNAYKTGAADVSSPLQEFRSIKEKTQQPLNMDTVSFSSKIENEMRRMVEETKPVSMEETIIEKTAEEMLVEKSEEISVEKVKMTGEEADLLYAAEEGISRVSEHLQRLSDLVNQLNEDYHSYTEKDHLEFQKELTHIMGKIDDVNKTLIKQAEESGVQLSIDISMDCEALGIDGISLMTEESALKAAETLDGAVVRAKEIENSIKSEIERLEKLSYEERLAEIEEAIKQMQRERMKAEEDRIAKENSEITFNAELSEAVVVNGAGAATENVSAETTASAGE